LAKNIKICLNCFILNSEMIIRIGKAAGKRLPIY